MNKLILFLLIAAPILFSSCKKETEQERTKTDTTTEQNQPKQEVSEKEKFVNEMTTKENKIPFEERVYEVIYDLDFRKDFDRVMTYELDKNLYFVHFNRNNTNRNFLFINYQTLNDSAAKTGIMATNLNLEEVLRLSLTNKLNNIVFSMQPKSEQNNTKK